MRCDANDMVHAEFLTAAVFVGMLIGGLVAGNAADRLGRRSCLLAALGLNCTFALLSAAAPSVGWLIAARVCAGLGKKCPYYCCDPAVVHGMVKVWCRMVMPTRPCCESIVTVLEGVMLYITMMLA